MPPVRHFRRALRAQAVALLVSALPVTISVPSRLHAQAAAPTAAASAPPTLLVQITVDQLVPGYFDRFASQLTGGLKRLATQGAFFTNAFHDHATTETAPGHATLWSGRFPAHHGIVLNELGVADAQSPLLFGRGGGASPWRFRGTALFDWIRTRDQFSRALSVSRKDRGAILPLGRTKQQVYWYSLDGRFTTSRYYADTVPTWVQRFNARNPVAPYLGAKWELLLPASAYPEPDSVSIESEGKNFTFPHELEKDARTGSSNLTEFPWMDDLTVDFALAGVEALDLGKGPTLDVLAVSLSTTDAVGHRYGPESRELHDQVLRVDRAIGRLLDSLYRMRDSTRVIVALSADHGVAPFPELKFGGSDPMRGRVDYRPVLDAARSALAARGVEGDALTIQSAIVFLDRRRLAAKGVPADSVIATLRAALLKLPGMMRVDPVASLARNAARGDKIARRWRQAIPGDFDAVLTLTYQPYFYNQTVRYATHGTPHDYDAHVPILFMGEGFRPGRYAVPARTVDIAPTLAQVLGITPLEPVDGRVLREALTMPKAGSRGPARRGPARAP